MFAALRDRLRPQSFEFFDACALKHVLHAGATAPFAETHPYYAIADVDADEAGLLEVFETCVGEGWVEDGVIAASDAQAEACGDCARASPNHWRRTRHSRTMW